MPISRSLKPDLNQAPYRFIFRLQALFKAKIRNLLRLIIGQVYQLLHRIYGCFRHMRCMAYIALLAKSLYRLYSL